MSPLMVVLLVLIIPAIICAILGLAGVRPAINWAALCGLLIGLALLLSPADPGAGPDLMEPPQKY